MIGVSCYPNKKDERSFLAHVFYFSIFNNTLIPSSSEAILPSQSLLTKNNPLPFSRKTSEQTISSGKVKCRSDSIFNRI